MDQSPCKKALVVIDPRHVDAKQLVFTISLATQMARKLGWQVVYHDQDLYQRLQQEGIRELVLCGVATNTSILATAQAGLRLGYQVTILADACTASTLGKHKTALQEIRRAGGTVVRLADLLCKTTISLTGLGAGGASLHLGAIDTEGGRLYQKLTTEVHFSTMRHRGGLVPRLMAIQGLVGEDGVEPLYRHPADEQPALSPFTPWVDTIRRAVMNVVGHPLNHCLIQEYRDGKDFIGEHTDKTLDLVRPSFIVNVSLGHTRTMLLKSKRGPGGHLTHETQRIPLPDGSVFLFDLESNREFSHGIRTEDLSDVEPGERQRISLTFRHIGTFFHRKCGTLFGVGAPTKTKEEARAISKDPAEIERMLELFHEENANPDFDPAAYRPGFTLLDLGTPS